MSADRTGRLGRLSIDALGTIVDVDQEFCRTMRVGRERILGRSILDFTAPADREQCVFLLAGLLQDGKSFATTKRLIRADSAHVWIHCRLAIESGDPVRISILFDESVPPTGWIDPAILLRLARRIYDVRRARDAHFSTSLFSDTAWDILLAAYINEARGKVLTAADLEGMIGVSRVNASRWVRALNAEGLVEYEEGGDETLITSAFRLSCDAHRKFERFLLDRYESESSSMRG